ncbi:hypothetical protein FRC05_008311 [Tulasnella sp. 425]|nr:hypothetical protein FRC05_008311 [Tulasnella sp. 425]
MSTLHSSTLKESDTIAVEQELIDFDECRRRFEKLLPVLVQYADEKVDIQRRRRFNMLCTKYIFFCESRARGSFFGCMLTPEGDIIEDEALAVLEAFRIALEVSLARIYGEQRLIRSIFTAL